MADPPTEQSSIHWPDDLAPEVCLVHTRNELSIAASAEQVWPVLVRAGEWSAWYANCRRLQFENGNGPDLAKDTRFRWTTFGARIRSGVVEFEPPFRLAWSAASLGSRVITEETQKGWGVRIIQRPLPQGPSGDRRAH